MINLRRFYLRRFSSFFKSAFPYQYNNEKGFAYLEILVVMSIMVIVFYSSAMIGRNFLVGTLAELEATRLISSMRMVQEYNRNSDYLRKDEFPKIMSKNATLLKMNVDVDRNLYNIMSSDGNHIFEKYDLPKNIRYAKTPQTFSKGIVFLPSGDMYSFGTVGVIVNIAGKSEIRYVVIDRAGRVRLDRNAP